MDDPTGPSTEQRADEAAEKIVVAAGEAEEKLAVDAKRIAAELKSDVKTLKDEIGILQDVSDFKSKVYVVAIVVTILEVAAFVGLWLINEDVNNGVRAIRRDVEVHRIRNEASHDCLAEKMAKLPSPEQRAQLGGDVLRTFVHEFLGCVSEVAPTITPPNVPNNPVKREPGEGGN